MPDNSFHHGVTGNEPLSGVVPIQTSATAVIGLIAYADDADPDIYPLNKPVLVTSMTRAFIGAGYKGTLRKALEAMQPITNPTMVVVRVENPFAFEVPDMDNSKVIGTVLPDGSRTGIQALLSTKSVTGVVPKINVAPFMETLEVCQALIAVNKRLRAFSYATPREANGAVLATMQEVTTFRDSIGDREMMLVWPEWTSGNVLLSGPAPVGVSAITLSSVQTGSVDDLNPAIGDTLTVSVNGTVTVSEAWSAELATEESSGDQWVTRALQQAGLEVMPALTGDITFNWLITAPQTGVQDVTITPTSSTRVKFRVGNVILNPVQFVLGMSTSGEAEYGPGILNAAAVVAALRAETDERVGWHKTISNIVVNGPTGMSKAITWDLEDPDTDAGYLNSHQVTTLIRHQGFRYWGNRTCASVAQFAFETSTRTAQILLDTLIQACFPFIDQPLTPFLAKDILDSYNAYLTRVSSGTERRLMGGRAWFDAAQNSTEQLTNGIMAIDYDYTPIAPFEHGILNQRMTGRYYINFAKIASGQGVTENAA